MCHNKYFGRSLNQESFIETIENFFKFILDPLEESQLRLDVITKVTTIVEELICVIYKLDSYRFYTASLLVTYDGEHGLKQARRPCPAYTSGFMNIEYYCAHIFFYF